ncbi:MAG: hypothetical protein P4M01_03125 [Acidobacteriota bacterium]|nr:hypothetical protein [Acidobacteriota bacterium]
MKNNFICLFVLLFSACLLPALAQDKSEPRRAATVENVLERYTVTGTDIVIYAARNPEGLYSGAVTISCKRDYGNAGFGCLADHQLQISARYTSLSDLKSVRSKTLNNLCVHDKLNEKLAEQAARVVLKKPHATLGPIGKRGQLTIKQFMNSDLPGFDELFDADEDGKVSNEHEDSSQASHKLRVSDFSSPIRLRTYRVMMQREDEKSYYPFGAEYELRDARGLEIAHLSVSCVEDASLSYLSLLPRPGALRLTAIEYRLNGADELSEAGIPVTEVCGKTRSAFPDSHLVLKALKKHIENLRDTPITLLSTPTQYLQWDSD